MDPMRTPLRSFWITLPIVWAVLCVGGAVYAHLLNLPSRLAAPVIAAFLWEASFYLVPGFAAVRRAIEERCRPWVLASFLAASALVPYCVYTVPTGLFSWPSLGLLAGLAVVLSFWYLLLPRNALADLAFVAFLAAVVLAGAFSAIYPAVAPKVPLEILGQLMLIRLGATVMLSLRREEGIGFGFVPSAKEWRIGIIQFLYFLPIGVPLALATGYLRFRLPGMDWWAIAPVAVGTFLGMFWVVALGEEFCFRGLLQQWLARWLRSRTAGLIVASVAFGLVHLPFRAFPNWRFALLAAIAGYFYGRAYQQSGGIRAAMVAHALTNTMLRMLFG
jgi:membrane protease YdiL (CAAX protease family)